MLYVLGFHPMYLLDMHLICMLFNVDPVESVLALNMSPSNMVRLLVA